jgi:hypothetical protein
MNLATQLLSQIDDSALSRNEQVRLRCQLARELEESGNYEAARGAMGGGCGRESVRDLTWST